MECVFCKIASGEIPSMKIFEDDFFMAVFDIKPANPGHFIVFPKKHIPFITEMNDRELGRLFLIIKELSKKIVSAVGAEGFNIIYSAGAVAGQITPHLIVHVIPRFKQDKVKIEWKPIQLSEELYKKIYEKILSKGETKQHREMPAKETAKKEKKQDDKKPEEIPKVSRKLPGYW